MGDSEEDDDYELIEASDVKSVNSEKSSKSNKSWVSHHTNKTWASHQTNKTEKSWVFAELRRELSDSYQAVDDGNDTHSVAAASTIQLDLSTWNRSNDWRGDLDQAEWGNEKEYRAFDFEKKAHDGLYGRTGRRKCTCRHCDRYRRSELEQPSLTTIYGQENLVSDFDLHHQDLSRATSLHKAKRWETIRKALNSVSIASGEIKGSAEKANRAKVTFFDVPIAGIMVSTSNRSESPINNLSGKGWSFLNRYKRFSVFCVLSDFRLETFVKDVEPYQMVRKLFSPNGIEEEAKKQWRIERVQDFKVSAYYGKLKPVLYHCPRGDMIPIDNISQAVKNTYNRKNALRYVSMSNYVEQSTRWANLGEVRNCFLPEVAFLPTSEYNSYQDWHLEFDVKRDRSIRGLLVAGKAPEIDCFPNHAWVRSHPLGEKIKKLYQGPVFPVLNPNQQHQFVKRFELFTRQEKGRWISHGVFQACDEMWVEKFIPLPEPQLCRFIRIVPLCKQRGGYEGDGPALRVVLFEERTGDGGMQQQSGVETQPSMRYVLHEGGEGRVQRKVQGPGSGAYEPYRDSWGVESKFLKRKEMGRAIAQGVEDYEAEYA